MGADLLLFLLKWFQERRGSVLNRRVLGQAPAREGGYHAQGVKKVSASSSTACTFHSRTAQTASTYP